MPCKATKQDGTPCLAPEDVLDVTGLCPAHGENAKQVMAERGSAGGKETQKRNREAREGVSRGLTSDELGELETPADALRWLRLIGGAVATGNLGDRPAHAATRAVVAWMQAFDVAELVARLEAAEARLEEILKLKAV